MRLEIKNRESCLSSSVVPKKNINCLLMNSVCFTQQELEQWLPHVLAVLVLQYIKSEIRTCTRIEVQHRKIRTALPTNCLRTRHILQTPLIEYIFHEEEVTLYESYSLDCAMFDLQSQQCFWRKQRLESISKVVLDNQSENSGSVYIFQFEQCVMIAHYFPDKIEYLWAVKRAKIVSFQEFLDDPGFLFGVISSEEQQRDTFYLVTARNNEELQAEQTNSIELGDSLLTMNGKVLLLIVSPWRDNRKRKRQKKSGIQ